MRRTIAALFTVVLVLFSAVGCGTMDNSSSDDGATTQYATTTTCSIDGETSTTLNGSTDTTTTTTKWKTTATTTPTETKPITYSDGKATLPLTGFCGMSADNKIIIQTNYIGYASNELTPPAAAFAYRGGEMIQLKPFDFTLTVNQEFSSLKETVTVPVRYFVMDSTVYAYAMAFPGASTNFISIPNDSQHVLLISGIVKRPVKVNVVTGTCEFLTTDYPDYAVFDTTVSPDGAYVVVRAGSSYDILHDGNSCQYVYHLQSRKLTKIPLSTVEDDVHFTPWCFVGDSLFIRCGIGPYSATCTWHEFDLSTGQLKDRQDLFGYTDLDAQKRPYRHLLYGSTIDYYDTSDELSVVNLKTAQFYTVKCLEELSFCGANENGDTVELCYRKEGEKTRIYSFVDMKTGKKTSLSDVTSDCVGDTYKGYCILGAEWCGENAVLINYTPEPDDPDQSRCLSEVIELPEW